MAKAKVLSAAEGAGLDYYLEKFRSVEPHRFAVIKVSGECIQDNLDTLVADLASIQSYGLQPVVLIGWGKILDKKMKERDMPVVKIGGFRYSDENVIDLITKEVIPEINQSFEAEAVRKGLKMEYITSPIFSVTPIEELKFVGKAVGVDISQIETACAEGKMPLVVPLGTYQGPQVYNINADTASTEIVSALHPLKFIGVTGTGGVLDRNGRIIRRISLEDDYDALTKGENPVISSGMKTKIDEAADLLGIMKGKKTNNGYCVELTSPKTLPKEIFTYKGAGTKITLGYKLHVHPWPNGVNISAANDLIERVSGKVIVPDYWQKEPINSVIDEVDDCSGIAVLEMYKDWIYMDKFYVDFNAQATGLGSKIFSAVWDYVQQNSPTKGLFWRASSDNSNLEWYTKRMREYSKNGIKIGMESEGDWFVCWMGGNRFHVGSIIEYAANKPKTLLDKS